MYRQVRDTGPEQVRQSDIFSGENSPSVSSTPSVTRPVSTAGSTSVVRQEVGGEVS